MDYCKHVNVFHGTGEIDLPKPEGIAAKWFFIKAGCGNTSPAAVLPFGAMSVSPFSGGYPTGYGDHKPNSHSRPAHFDFGKKLIGFSHLHQSGTGAIGYYYNYAVTTPAYKNSEYRRDFFNEYAEPGYYSCVIEDIRCEITVNQKTAFHRYTFGKNNGKVTIDFSNNGLIIPECENKKVFNLKLKQIDKNTISASAVIEGIKIFFAAKGNSECRIDGGKAIFSVPENLISEIQVSVSFNNSDTALNNISDIFEFNIVRDNAYKIWNNKLGLIRAEFNDERLYEIFYSNLYHSFIKPSDWYGESFVYDKNSPFMTDFATLWDMYKTALPLIFLTDKDTSESICETLLKLGETLGHLPNNFGISDQYNQHSEQARMLGAYALITAYRYGISMDPYRLLNVIKTDINADDKSDFTTFGRCKSHTFMLDMADACALAAEIAAENGNKQLKESLMPLAAQWKKVYNVNAGLLEDDCEYYEGTHYNYSFRQMYNMDERIIIAGGKEKFIKLLDDFFGYGKDDVIQPTDPFNYKPVEEGIKLGRFEGFNNESDIEAPFSYIYVDRHDRTCEIIRAGLKYMFTAGRGGLPGNNDSGALSSYYVFNAVGIYPIAGRKYFHISFPLIKNCSIQLSSGKQLLIEVIDNSDENIYVKEVYFNNKRITDFKLSADEIFKGGKLQIVMYKK